MLVDHYKAEDVFSRVPRMAERIDPVLNKLDQLLDDDELYSQVRADFGKRYRYTLVHGRHSTPVEVILRMLICKHLHQWSYQETEEQVDQNLILRWFCRLYWAPVPNESTLVRWANTLQPNTLHAPGRPGGRTGAKGEGDQGAQTAPGCHVCADDHPSSDRQRPARR
jgi:transposase, IS5 family